MDTETVRLNITLPRDLVTALNEKAGPRKKSQYIARAVRNQIEKDLRESLDKELEEGYRKTAAESRALSQEFEHADIEGWDDY